jgi:antitoxin component of MazEF toxin-antitoxin module
MSEAPKYVPPEDHALHIRKIGNTLTLILPRDVMARLHLKEGDRLVVAEQEGASAPVAHHDDKHKHVFNVSRKSMEDFKQKFQKAAVKEPDALV